MIAEISAVTLTNPNPPEEERKKRKKREKKKQESKNIQKRIQDN